MEDDTKSILVVGFNTRPLAYSLNNAGYDVYAVDFFGDLDLYPYVKDSIVVVNALNSNYKSLKDTYSQFLAQYTLQLHSKYQDVDFLLIGSGLDDNYEGAAAHFDVAGTVNITCLDSACNWYSNATDSCMYWPSGGKDCGAA